MRSFGRDKVLEQLALLSERHRAAYAAACAERLIPLYRWFQEVESWGDTGVLERGIELVWNWVRGEQHDNAEFAEAIQECEAVTPDTDEFGSPLASRALDAGSAVAQALEACISPIPETAADAGEIAWECAFGVEQSRLLEAGVEHIADRKTIMKAAQGSLVLLEEDLQRRSLQSLRQESFTNKEFDDFRKEFAKLAD
jgi:uncharacterized protein YjaG (DUF416 family)